MSKERLEVNHAIEVIKRETVISKGFNNTDDNVNLPIDLVLVLIEQAERVQELEEDIEYLSHNFGIEAEQNKLYRERIEEIRGYMEKDSIMMLSEEDRLKGIHEVLKKHYTSLSND